MSINYKAQLNGLRKTNWSNKTEDKVLKILEDKYDKIGRPLPKYLTNGKLTDKKVNRAVTSLENMYSRKIQSIENKKVPVTKRLYKEYRTNRKNEIEYLKNQIKNYPKEIQDAYIDKKTVLSIKLHTINKQDMSILTMKDFKQMAKNEGVSVNKMLRDYVNKQSVYYKEDYIKQGKNLIEQIFASKGMVLDEEGKKNLFEKLNDVGYIEYDFLIQRWEKRLEAGYYEVYKNKYNLHTEQDVIDSLRSDIMANLPNRRKFMID